MTTVERDVLVWKYGTRSAEVPEEAGRQLRLAHELREHLVELVFERERAVAVAWETHPEIGQCAQARDNAQVVVDGLLDRAAEYRKTTRDRQIPAELRAEIKAARQIVKDAKRRLREVKGEAYAAVAPLLHQARDQERRSQKAAYAEFVQRAGLYWATYNRVLEQHKIAERRVGARRKQGQPAQLRHHRYDGTGRIAVQLQRAADAPPRTADLLSAPESPWRNVLLLPAVCATDPDEWRVLTRSQQRYAGRQHIKVRLTAGGREPTYWELPVQVHRPIPPGAEVVAGEVVITKVADKQRITVNLTLRAPKTAPVEGGTVAVDIGWRTMPDDSIRVGYWRAIGQPRRPIRVPDHLRDVVLVTHGGREGEVRIPASWRRLDERLHEIRSGRDTDLNRLKPIVAEWLAEHPSHAEALQTTPADVTRWRSPARMVTFARRLAEHDETASLLMTIRAWERQDRHLWQWEANERDQLVARRRDAYRATAAILTSAWPHAILERRFVATLIRRPVGEDTDSQQAEHARSQARLAAPAELADAIGQASQRGGSVIEIDAKLTTRRHHICGQLLPTEADTARGLLVTCPTCDLTFDQDANAVMNMLREGSAGGPSTADLSHHDLQAKHASSDADKLAADAA